MMKKMKKDETIGRAFDEYFDGSEAPHCDLTQAKQALSRSVRERSGGVIFLKAASAFACFLVVCIVSVGIVFGMRGDESPSLAAPSGAASYYALSSAQTETATYAGLSQTYGGVMSALAPFEWADNAQADYTLYSVDGEDVLIGASLKYLYDTFYWEGELYIDLTGGESIPEEFKPYERLPYEGSAAGRSYTYSTQYVNGEYVSDARLSLPSADCYMTVMSRSENAVYFLLNLLAENS